ncbi:MAG: TlpA family protein disulfide reductase [Bacteroidetes bacterium]|nr:TlpA family protein disulfide reductase [Bacteroidota bacterium]MBS1591037.1 TlpA family protein disulfide reductase [Bacteroidota bacterium]
MKKVIYFLWFICVLVKQLNAQAKLEVCFEGMPDSSLIKINPTINQKDSGYTNNSTAIFYLNNISTEYEVYFISCPKKLKGYSFPLFIKKNTNVFITISKDLKKVLIKGNDNIYNQQNDYYVKWDSLYKTYKLISDSIAIEKEKNEKVEIINERDKHAKLELETYPIKWVEEHKKSSFSPAVIRLFIDKTNVLQGKIDSISLSCFELLHPDAKLNNSESDILQQNFALFDNKYAFLPVGSVSPNFQLKDIKGEIINLNSFKGKWVLLDFWASYCIPCRENNAVLKLLFEKYNKINFTVISISADIDKENWVKAIKEDGMVWHQVSDFQSIKSGVMKMYHINALPTYFLISPNGIVAAHSIGGNIKLIEEVLNNIISY